MVRAFAILQERREGVEEPVVSHASWNQLVRLVQSDLSHAHRELLWSVADHHNQGYIGRKNDGRTAAGCRGRGVSVTG